MLVFLARENTGEELNSVAQFLGSAAKLVALFAVKLPQALPLLFDFVASPRQLGGGMFYNRTRASHAEHRVVARTPGPDLDPFGRVENPMGKTRCPTPPARAA